MSARTVVLNHNCQMILNLSRTIPYWKNFFLNKLNFRINLSVHISIELSMKCLTPTIFYTFKNKILLVFMKSWLLYRHTTETHVWFIRHSTLERVSIVMILLVLKGLSWLTVINTRLISLIFTTICLIFCIFALFDLHYCY